VGKLLLKLLPVRRLPHKEAHAMQSVSRAHTVRHTARKERPSPHGQLSQGSASEPTSRAGKGSRGRAHK
jgi:hypothetical protein